MFCLSMFSLATGVNVQGREFSMFGLLTQYKEQALGKLDPGLTIQINGAGLLGI